MPIVPEQGGYATVQTRSRIEYRDHVCAFAFVRDMLHVERFARHYNRRCAPDDRVDAAALAAADAEGELDAAVPVGNLVDAQKTRRVVLRKAVVEEAAPTEDATAGDEAPAVWPSPSSRWRPFHLRPVFARLRDSVRLVMTRSLCAPTRARAYARRRIATRPIPCGQALG